MEYYDIIDDSSSILLGCRTARSLSSVPEIGGCEGDENCNCSDGSHQDGDGSTITAGVRIDDTSSSIFPPNYDESRVSSSNHNHQYNNSNDDNQRSKSRRKRMYHWWTDILSRVSRSASSLLNQHTPKLDDIFDTGDHENGQLADVSQLQSQQRQHNPLDEVQSSNSSANSISRRGGNSRLLRPGREESITSRNNGNSDTNCNDDEKNETIIALQEEIALLKQRIHTLEYIRDEELWHGGENVPASLTKSSAYKSDSINDIPHPLKPVLSLTPDQITRYSRQLLLNDGFGIVGQCKLLSSSILVIGAGGIGSTVLLYLAAVGVGHITVVDYDTIEMSNLHRQIIYKDVNATSKKKKKNKKSNTTTTNKGHKVASDEEMRRRGMLNNNKAISAKYAMLELNPTLSCTALTIAITATNALDLISKHDAIVDASDNPQTRYIMNDACILANKPLVSGSAMGTEGQLTVYNYQPTATATATADSDNVTPTSSAENNNDNGGGRGILCSTKQQQQRTACYRCLYPKSTTTDGCKSCSDNGVLGMVPGVIGILQAVEVIKILTDIGHVMHDQLVMYDSLHGTFMNIKKPPPRINCAICSIAATITTMEESEQSLLSVRGPSVSSSSTTLIPSTTTCPLGDSGGGGTANVQSISCIEYNNNVRNIGQPHILLDVRVPRQYEMCSLDGSINLPLEELESQLDTTVGGLSHGQLPIYCLCRRGIASVAATRIIQNSINDGNAAIHSVYNITGGLHSWVETVDSDFPEY